MVSLPPCSNKFSVYRVPESVLQVKFSAICQVLLSRMAAKADSQSTALLKSVRFSLIVL